jgi:glycosyltransferase involved in cell wall biosynthesis
VRLLFLTDGLWPFQLGGMQRHSTLLIAQLASRVESLTVVYCGAAGEQAPDICAVEATMPETSRGLVEWVPVAMPGQGSLPGHYIREMRSYAKAVAATVGVDFDVSYAQGMTGLALLNGPFPVMVNLHGLNMFFQAHTAKQWLTQRMLQPIARQMLAADSLVSLGGELTEMLMSAGCDQTRIVNLSNALDPEEIPEKLPLSRLNPEIGRPPRFVLVGRHEPAKGFDVLIAALEMMDLAIDLDLVGEWPDLVSPPHRVKHHGVVMDRIDLMQTFDQADVLLSASYSEGMPTVVLEAMARGLAVVATDVGAVRELVDEETGWCVPAGDPEALAEAMTAAAWAEPSVLQSMGEKAHKKVQRYTWPRIADETVKALEAMISQWKSR